MRIGDTVYLEKPYRGYRWGELVGYHHPYWTVRLESGLEIECYEDELRVNADLGMGTGGANTVYMFNDKKVKAASKTDKELQDRLNAPTTKDSGTAQKIKDMAERVKLSDDVAKSIANVYDGLDGLGKDALKRYLQNLSFPITNQVATLLGQMIEEVPLETYRDIKDVGFLSDAAKGGNSDDLFAIKAACGLRQAGKDISELFENGQFRSREEIEEAVSMAIGEHKKERKGKNFYDDPKKQDMMNALREMHHSDNAIVRAIEEVYESTANEDANFANVTKYLRENNAPKAKLLRYADKGDRDKYFKEHGIKPQKADPSHSACSIGFSEKEQKWYGWSHRAMCGFGIGHKVKEGDCGADGWAEGQKGIKPGFVCETIDDCEKVARAFARSVASIAKENTQYKLNADMDVPLPEWMNEPSVSRRNSEDVYIPDNEYGIREGYYSNTGIVWLLRKHSDNPKTIYFIADMLE